MALITLTEYKTFIGKSNPNDDAKLQPLVDMANEYIPLYCNTPFESTVVTGKRLTNFEYSIILPHAPILSVEDLKVIISGNQVDIDSADYIVDLEEGIIHLVDYTGAMPTKSFGFLADYTYGAATIPKPVMLAAFELVRHYEKREFNKQKDLGNGQKVDYSPTEVIPQQVRSMLDVYRVL